MCERTKYRRKQESCIEKATEFRFIGSTVRDRRGNCIFYFAQVEEQYLEKHRGTGVRVQPVQVFTLLRNMQVGPQAHIEGNFERKARYAVLKRGRAASPEYPIPITTELQSVCVYFRKSDHLHVSSNNTEVFLRLFKEGINRAGFLFVTKVMIKLYS